VGELTQKNNPRGRDEASFAHITGNHNKRGGHITHPDSNNYPGYGIIHCSYNAGCLFVQAGGKIKGIEAGTVLGVDIVDPNGFTLHQDLIA